MVMATEPRRSPDFRPTRRTLLAGAALLPAVALAAPVEPDPHVAWAAEADDLYRQLWAGAFVGRSDAVLDHVCALKDRVCAMPARTLAGVRTQLATALEFFEAAHGDEAAQVGGLRNALATLDRLAGEGRA